MNIFDEYDNIIERDTDIIDNVSSDTIMSSLYNKWLDHIYNTPKKNHKLITHNVKTVNNTDEIYNIVFSLNKSNPYIICPLDFITSCPKLVSTISIDNSVSIESTALVLYTYSVITKNDIDKLQYITYSDKNSTLLNEIVIQGTFESIDIYYEFINLIKQQFKDIKNIHLSPHTFLNYNNSILNFTHFINAGVIDADVLLYNGFVDIIYNSYRYISEI